MRLQAVAALLIDEIGDELVSLGLDQRVVEARLVGVRPPVEDVVAD
jgi:hypothetical protein